MGVALSLWPDASQLGDNGAPPVAGVNDAPADTQAEDQPERMVTVGAALIQEARDVNIQDQANVNVVGGNQTVTVNHTVINIANGEGPETAIQIIRENLDPAKYPSIQQDVYHNRAKGSGLWFLGTPEFKRWWRKEGRVLWATGMPGAGKTHVAACSIHDALEKAKTTENVAVCYGYFQYSDPKPTVKVLQALVRQHAEYCPPGAELVAATIKERKKEGRELSEADCIDLLKYMCERIESWFYLDALDESPHDAQFDFLELCATIPAQVCIFSRPLMDMQHHLQESLGECGVTFATIVAQDKDIELLVNQKIDSTPGLRRLLASKEGLRKRISQKVIENACGMFVHAALQIEFIRHLPTAAQIESKLDAIPKGMDGMYDETMRRIDEQPEALADLGKRALLWVAYGERQLKVNELQRALATEVETGAFDEDNIAPEDRILAACCGLLTLTSEGEFRLVHMTALEAVRKLLQKWFPYPHSDLARVCVATLVSSGLASGSFFEDVNHSATSLAGQLDRALSQVPLLEYAHKHFALHLRHGLRAKEPRLSEPGLSFLRQCTSFPLHLQIEIWGEVIRAAPLHVGAYFDIPDLLHSLLQQAQSDINLLSLPGGDDRLTPLMVACVFGNIETVEYIISLPGVDLNCKAPDGWTALHWAASRGHKGVVSCLLNCAAVDRNAQDDNGWTPLMLAISWCRESVALQILGTPGIDLTTVSPKGHTPLSFAIDRGFPELALKILDLEPGLDPNIHDPRYHRPPLTQAAGAGYGQVVERLLAHPGIRLVHPDANSTPLTSALDREHPDIARHLLAFPGVDAIINVPGVDDWTPLMRASREGYDDIVKQILAIGKQHGMNLKNIDEDGNSALTTAFGSHHPAVARLLVEEDLGIDCWNNSDIQAQVVKANLMEKWRILERRSEWVLQCIGQLQQWVRDGCPSEFEFEAQPQLWGESDSDPDSDSDGVFHSGSDSDSDGVFQSDSDSE